VGLQSVINFGPNELGLADAVAQLSDGAARPVFCSVTELIALTRRAAIFIGGDTGPLHLAAALKIPCVALFGPTDPARNGPYGTQSVVLRSQKSVTSYSHVADADPGLQSINADEAVRAAAQLLGVTIG
jgi:heptosyltransferase-1